MVQGTLLLFNTLLLKLFYTLTTEMKDTKKKIYYLSILLWKTISTIDFYYSNKGAPIIIQNSIHIL